MRKSRIAFCLIPLIVAAGINIPLSAVPQEKAPALLQRSWKGKRVAILGDSITDKNHIGTTKNYWQYLEEMLGFEPLIYGINGHQWNDLPGQLERLKAERGDSVDVILIFAGTNDYNANVPLGSWYEEEEVSVEVSEPRQASRRHRILSMDKSTLRGRVNQLFSILKRDYPTKQVIVLTPLHRGYAYFGEKNIQPDESYANALGLFVDAYVETIKEISNVWAVPVIDLNSISGLYPNIKEQADLFFHDKEHDRLHPNAEGHRRIALTLGYQLLGYPAGFD